MGIDRILPHSYRAGMTSIKSGVKVGGLKPEALLAINIAAGVYRKYGYDLVLTSALDGAHSPNSRHYVGLAIDIRTRDIARYDLADIIQDLKTALGDEYDVVLEHDHLHVEHDPG